MDIFGGDGLRIRRNTRTTDGETLEPGIYTMVVKKHVINVHKLSEGMARKVIYAMGVKE